MIQVSPEAPLFLLAGTDRSLILQAALAGAAMGMILVAIAFAWRLRPHGRQSPSTAARISPPGLRRASEMPSSLTAAPRSRRSLRVAPTR